MPGKRKKKKDRDRKTSGRSNVIDIREERRARDQNEKEAAAAVRKKKKKKNSLTSNKLVAIIVGIIIILLLLSSLNNIIDLKQQEHKAQQEVASLKAQKAEMEKTAEDADTDEYIEQQARTWLKMARQGDVIYIMNGEPLLQDSGITQEQEEAEAKKKQNKSDNNL